MKKVLLFLACACLFSCQSRDAKISKLIKDEMFKTLYDFESYEPIETSKIDSVYTTIYTDSIIVEQAIKIVAAMTISEELLDEITEHNRTIEIWEDSYSSTARKKVYNARDEIRKIRENLRKALNIVSESTNIISEEIDKFESEFIGWSVTHKFRCKNKGGNFDLGTYKYVFDPKFEKILYTVDENSEDNEKVYSMIKNIAEIKEKQDKEKKEKEENLEL